MPSYQYAPLILLVFGGIALSILTARRTLFVSKGSMSVKLSEQRNNRTTHEALVQGDVPRLKEDCMNNSFLPPPANRISIPNCRLQCPLYQNSRSCNGDDEEDLLLGIVTAFSQNHVGESLGMIQSLMDVNYTGPLAVYFMRRSGEVLDNRFLSYCNKLSILQQGLCVEVIDYEFHEQEDFGTYCFKPTIVNEFITHHKFQVVMWVDSSGRFKSDPQSWARNMVNDGIDFAGKEGSLRMSENTHADTYQYLNVSRIKYRHHAEIAATFFLVRLVPHVVFGLLQPWIDCGTRACQTCMTPKNCSRKYQSEYKVLHAPSTLFQVHRHDQSVLGILVMEWKTEHNGNVIIYPDQNAEKYINISKPTKKGSV